MKLHHFTELLAISFLSAGPCCSKFIGHALRHSSVLLSAMSHLLSCSQAPNSTFKNCESCTALVSTILETPPTHRPVHPPTHPPHIHSPTHLPHTPPFPLKWCRNGGARTGRRRSPQGPPSPPRRSPRMTASAARFFGFSSASHFARAADLCGDQTSWCCRDA